MPSPQPVLAPAGPHQYHLEFVLSPEHTPADLAAQAARFKHVPEAVTARDEPIVDPSPPGERPEVKATFYYQATPGTAFATRRATSWATCRICS